MSDCFSATQYGNSIAGFGSRRPASSFFALPIISWIGWILFLPMERTPWLSRSSLAPPRHWNNLRHIAQIWPRMKG